MTNDNLPPHGGHDVPLTPPPAPAPDQATAQEPTPPPYATENPAATTAPPRNSARKPILIVTAVVGGLALLGVGGTGAFAAVSDLTRSDSASTLDVTGVKSLDLEVGASDVTVEFGDVDQAELVVTGGRGGQWTLDRDDDELVVRSPQSFFGWSFGNWFGNWFGNEERVLLTLPDELQGSMFDADLSLSAGSLDVEGDFGTLVAEVGAGALTVSGSASEVDADINAGRAEINMANVDEADFTIAAGRLIADLTGTAPDSVTIDVSAGSLDLTVPDESYDVRSEVSAGSFDNRLDVSTTSRHSIVATVSAGSATVEAGD
ncbi:MAG: hypothetical protein ACQEW8_12935 [Actinomycetota bacterium]